MRVLSDGARRLINEMKKLRLSLIFNEQGRASVSASERTRIQWPSVPGARRRRTSKYHLSESRRAFTCARLSRRTLGRLERRIRSFGRIRVFPLYFLRRESLLTVPQHGRCARRLALLLFRLAIVKYKRLVRSADSPPVHLGFVRNEYLVDGRNICSIS